MRIVLEQQVSLASAAALWERLERLGAATPDGVAALGADGLRAAGATRPKARTLVGLAGAVRDGSLDPGALAALDDDAVRARLTRLHGIGPWTAEVYLLTALGRPDAFPASDLALLKAARATLGLPARPTPAELELRSRAWRPRRALAARLLWRAYLEDPAVRRG